MKNDFFHTLRLIGKGSKITFINNMNELVDIFRKKNTFKYEKRIDDQRSLNPSK